ncbi:hypothetical protein ILYODFUR_031095 [Ilyodon furcidens]|uniref:Uncharacterized protein n=1 Tax=Ilyodon furcidens TaxID=33524 RepID=A0ABV0TZ78_9TELE
MLSDPPWWDGQGPDDITDLFDSFTAEQLRSYSEEVLPLISFENASPCSQDRFHSFHTGYYRWQKRQNRLTVPHRHEQNGQKLVQSLVCPFWAPGGLWQLVLWYLNTSSNLVHLFTLAELHSARLACRWVSCFRVGSPLPAAAAVSSPGPAASSAQFQLQNISLQRAGNDIINSNGDITRDPTIQWCEKFVRFLISSFYACLSH